ncbi:MAG: hypothetical protein KC656_26100, partial [Myxococcales bacterium]|nr:hypothetical protein [Myxococcales bacterium]
MPSQTRRTSTGGPTTQMEEQGVAPAPLVSNEALAAQAKESGGGGVSGYLSDLIRDKVTADKVDDAVTGGVSSGGSWLKDQMVGAASEEDKAIAREHGGAKIDELTGGLNEGLRDSELGESIAGFAADHPLLTTGVAAAGVAGYILSDQDLKFGTGMDIGDRHRLDVSGEFGTTLHPGIDAVRGGYTYDDGTNRARIEGGSRFDRDEWDVRGEYRRKLDEESSLTFSGSHVDKAGDTFSQLGVNYDSKDLGAYARGSYDSAKDLGRFQAGFTKT